MFESHVSVVATEKLSGWEKHHATSGPPIWKDMLKSALKDIVSWRTKSQVLVWMIIDHERGA